MFYRFNYRLRSVVAGVLAVAFLLASAQAASVWKVEGGKSTVYLAGSVHFLRNADQVPSVYDQVYADSELVVLEVEPHRMQESGAAQMYVKEGRCSAGEKIKDHLDDEVNQLLEKRLRQLPNHAAAVRRMRPWMAGMFLTIRELQRLKAQPELGIDHVYYQRARRDGKSTASLESPLLHVKLLSSLTRQEQNVFLEQTLLTLDETESMFDDLLEAWQQGEEEVLAGWFHDIQMTESGITEKILLQRNRNWINALETYLQGDQTVMVIAGVGHMVGEGSVVDLLKKRGYTIRKLNESS